MGRKAKLKHQRKSSPLPETPGDSSRRENTDFVQDLQQQGYSLQQSQTAPKIPDHCVKPQL